jgi:hypothetical protein
MDKIIVFEDQVAKRIDLIKRLRNRLKDKHLIESVDGSGEQEPNRTYEAQLEALLREKAPGGALIVCDKDLSNMGKQFVGLSGTTVATVADKLGFPLCLYARGEGLPQGEDFLRSLAPWEKKRITLEYSSEETLVEECACIFRSFSEIERSYMNLDEEDRATPAAALSRILGQPGIEDRIALYGSGEQGLLEEIMPFQRRDDIAYTKRELTKRMPRFLGNWLYTSILRFPGILVREVPAASYLNIDPRDFAKANVQKLFARAKYKGPFSGLHKWWWRHILEQMLNESRCQDGLAFAKIKKVRVRACKDSQTGQRAGYYCMVTEEPVSGDNSKSGISWFPSGADLARLRLDKFNELAPWIGIY